jgi:hypothetical protein
MANAVELVVALDDGTAPKSLGVPLVAMDELIATGIESGPIWALLPQAIERHTTPKPSLNLSDIDEIFDIIRQVALALTLVSDLCPIDRSES